MAPPSLTILETSQISPSAAAAAAPPPPTNSLPLTFFDIFWLYSPPVERLFFYEFSAAAAAAPSFLPALKSSLSLALQSYFPLAGRLRRSPAAADRYEIFCSAGDSVAFTFAETVDGGELDFDELSGGRPRDAAKLRMLVPELELRTDERPQALLAIQVTAFPRRGAAVGVAVHHAACDGSTSTRFLNAWAADSHPSDQEVDRGEVAAA
ncbi:malonyl-coenzyme A:anthocyanin 3-O-glucoside-6''-O-malonyltransferase-like, partial [Ananas comosus]|uniref:Malonyl-coenzyme A:anthocyanin 3-O-glucoside-6''-O-malonyltransferase-like n=1 Tax=Ananas comosus TaxID=4615 RepID=A0A6P5FNQ5_ANACO